jgi:hypothetical protein
LLHDDEFAMNSYEHFQRYVSAAALAITDPSRNPAICLAGFD